MKNGQAHEAQTDGRRLDMFVLDVLRHDIESLSSILNLLNSTSCVGWRGFWPRDFTAEEVVPVLAELAERGFVEPLRPDAGAQRLERASVGEITLDGGDSLWFRLTKAGLQAWEQWEPPREEDEAGE